MPTTDLAQDIFRILDVDSTAIFGQRSHATEMLSGRLSLENLTAAVIDGSIDTVVVAMVDMQGRLIGKRLTGRFFIETGACPQLLCDYFLATDMEMTLVPGYETASWKRGYGDFALVPDMATMRVVPWLARTAIVLADVSSPSGAPLNHSPRQILRNQLRELAKLGFVADMAAELEFYLFNQTFEDARLSKYEDLKFASSYPADAQVFQSTKDETYVRTVRNLMELADIPIECSKAEWSQGQQEINLQYAEALETCDRLVLYKNGCKEIAHKLGKSVSFMAKLDENLAGNSCHIHLSLRNIETGDAGFHDATATMGMSTLFRKFLAGVITHSSAATYFYAPNINSYKRFSAGTFAPTRIAWSVDNRTTAYRVLGNGKALRFECRVPGADANPYLAFAALIASGIRGVTDELVLPDAHEGDVYESSGVSTIPGSLYQSLNALERSPVFSDAFGHDVVRHYLHCGRWELSAFEKVVTNWEKHRLFERC